MDQLLHMVQAFMAYFPVVHESLRKTFNTATVQFAVSGKFEATAIKVKDLERILAGGFTLPEIDVPAAILPFADRWWKELGEELEPLAGKTVDSRFVEGIHLV
jgi:hypothetical protein